MLLITKLTLNEEKGFGFEGEISESLFRLHLEHDELPHLFRSEFKKNVSKGVDFRLSVNGYKVMAEAKKWKHAHKSWLPKITDRFMGKNNYGDKNICVVKNIHGSNFFRYRHELREHGIKLMADYEFSWFIYKLMKRPCKIYSYYNTDLVLSDVILTLKEVLKKKKQYINQSYIPHNNSRLEINDSVEGTMKIRLQSEFYRGEQYGKNNFNN